MVAPAITPKRESDCDVLIVGAGPAGYAFTPFPGYNRYSGVAESRIYSYSGVWTCS
ncbi:hypothetical protein K440DRAFT_627181 [Wilcoxina mikolae CBS 423.85]|nr:hypothetical protein K440DRAFT_627181 [Wilcoxina mikolae CBS 423.85]